MSQQRLTLFFPRNSSKTAPRSPRLRCHLLELPYSIRRRIYLEAGFPSGLLIDMNGWRSSRRADHRHSSSTRPSIPVELMAVCRVVHEEIVKILYGENQIRATRCGSRGLKALENLTDAAVRELRYLMLRLNLFKCDTGNCRCSGEQGSCYDAFSFLEEPVTYESPLDKTSHTDNLVMLQCQRICARLAICPPGQLALYVICDCKDLETAKNIVLPFRGLPLLEDCALRLAEGPNADFQSLAEEVVYSVCQQERAELDPNPFSFNDLPKEIQLNILKHTSLVSSAVAYVCEGALSYGSPCRSTAKMNTYTDPKLSPSMALLKVFCKTKHSAFNFWCRCAGRGFPSSLFLVSREFNGAATATFYGLNRFQVQMNERDEFEYVACDLASHRIRPSLSHFPSGSIRHCTSIVLRFGSTVYQCREDQPEDELEEQPSSSAEIPGQLAWYNTVDILSKDANLGILNLEIQMSEHFFPDPEGWPQNRDRLGANYERSFKKTCDWFFPPLKALSGLKNLFIHMNWDTSCSHAYSFDGRAELEEKYESMVMGTGYDAWKCGKTMAYYCVEGDYCSLARHPF